MKCSTIERYDSKGLPVYKPKKSFNTLDEAIAVAKIENASPKQQTKLVAYKCDKCYKYHIGKNGKQLDEKYKTKLSKEIRNKITGKLTKTDVGLVKIVGYIDLSKIKY